MLNVQCDLTIVLNVQRDLVSVADIKDQELFSKAGGECVKKKKQQKCSDQCRQLRQQNFGSLLSTSLYGGLLCTVYDCKGAS